LEDFYIPNKYRESMIQNVAELKRDWVLLLDEPNEN
jgi:hypothetical protein